MTSIVQWSTKYKHTTSFGEKKFLKKKEDIGLCWWKYIYIYIYIEKENSWRRKKKLVNAWKKVGWFSLPKGATKIFMWVEHCNRERLDTNWKKKNAWKGVAWKRHWQKGLYLTFKKRKKWSDFIFCNIPQKKKKMMRENWHWLVRKRKKKKISKIQKKKILVLLFDFYLKWAEIEPSHWAIKLRSWAKTISRSEPLSHWVAIRAIKPWFDQAKPRLKSPSQNQSHQASKLRSEPSSRDTSQVESS